MSEPTKAQPGSARDQLRRRREHLKSKKTLDLLVPGYQGLLGVRYRALGDDEFEQLIKKMGATDRVDAQSNIDAALDLLIRSCECILIDEGNDLEPLTDDGDVPIAYDVRLAETLGYADELGDSPTARAIVRGLFSPEGHAPLAPAGHADSLVKWLQGNEQAIDQALLGE